MAIVKTILLFLVALVVLVITVGLFLPSSFQVMRSAEVNAPAEKVYGYLADPRQWARWAVWNQRDPAMKVTYSGPPSGRGAKWAWESATEGTGSMEFTLAEPNRVIEYALSFPEFGMRSAGTFTLQPTAAGTKVTWTNAGDVGANPLKHYFALFMDRMVGPDFEQGLANLKALAERP